jgi:hypothetical protein
MNSAIAKQNGVTSLQTQRYDKNTAFTQDGHKT